MPFHRRPSLLSQPALGLVAVAAQLGLAAPLAQAQRQSEFEQAPINYSTTVARDALAALQTRITDGELIPRGDERKALQALLDALRVPVSSQVLVFSKTSLQRNRIHPERPRALYFSDTAYVGWVPGGLIEVSAIDPQLGPIFYTVDLASAGKTSPVVTRESDCLRCHGGTFVRDIPAVFARSVFSDASGEPLLRHGTLLVDDETPFAERWGGWYVTGYHGTEPHRGNTFAAEVAAQLVFAPSMQRPDTLEQFFDSGSYLAPTSDVVALLVLEHQMAVQNALTRAAFACRRMIAYQHGLQTAFKEPITDEPAYDSVKSVFHSAVQDVVDRLLFREAAPLPAGVVGHAAFREAFQGASTGDGADRPLRIFQLRDRLFENRCSYLIFSEMFGALPPTLKQRIFDRLRAALQSRDPADRYAYLSADEKERIFRVLRDGHPDAANLSPEGSPARPANSPE